MIHIPVFLSADNNYAPLIATTVASICDNTKSFVDFYVLDGGISEENKQKIATLKNQFKNFEIEYIAVDISKYISLKDYKNICIHVTASTYNSLLIPSLKKNLENTDVKHKNLFEILRNKSK